jgi:MYXO-CTERM domain-containing protein
MAIAMASVVSLTAACDRTTPGQSLAGPAATAVSVSPAAAAPQLASAPRPGFVRLARSQHPFARPEVDAGRVEPGRKLSNLSLFFKLSAEQRRGRDALAAAQLDRGSPLYHQWLTPETYRARFGAKAEDATRAAGWLAAQGLEVHRVSPLGTRVTFSGTVAELEAAFQTEFHYYRVAGETHYAMATAPALPEDFADAVLSVYNANDFVHKPASRRVNAGAAARRGEVTSNYQLAYDAGPDASGVMDLLGPPDWATAYDVAKLYSPGIGGKALDGTGVTIGIVGTAPIAQSDIDAFRARFGLPASTVTMTLVPNTGSPSTAGFGGGVEAILDVEWSGGVAKGATVNYVYVGQDDFNVDDATFYLIEHNLTPIVSESYGGCEEGDLPTDADVTEMNGTAANLMGITYMAAAGDSGAEDCGGDFGAAYGGSAQAGLYIDLPGGFPGVTSVGGTQFPSPLWSTQGNLVDAGLEQVWNESNDPYSNYGAGAGGGGISSVFTRPAYQTSAATCTPIGSLPTPSSGPMRQVPDVAVSAAAGTPGYFIECTFAASKFGGGDCSGTGGSPEGTAVGGTSAASPSFAGVVAILNQATGERLGNINPMLYELAASPASSSAFHDIVSGNNEIVCGPGASDAGDPPDAEWPDAGCSPDGLNGYVAVPGYDCASGIGSVDAYNLVSAWLGATPTQTVLVPSPAMTTEGATVTLTATVDPVGTDSNPIAGTVMFAFQSYAADCSNDLSWELGSATIANGTAASGTAVLQTTVPPGLVIPGRQRVDLVASYGGDIHHLASRSSKVSLAFAPVTFAVTPAAATVAPDAGTTLSTTGGVTPPVRWFILDDTTQQFSMNGFSASSIDESSGAFSAAPNSGYVLIQALDKFGAEALAEVTVGSPTSTAPWANDGGASLCAVDGGPNDAGVQDAAPATTLDATTSVDSGAPKEVSAGGGGCNCEAAGGIAGPSGAGLAALGGLMLVAARRRRRSPGA